MVVCCFCPSFRLRNVSLRLRNVSLRLRNVSFRLRNVSFPQELLSDVPRPGSDMPMHLPEAPPPHVPWTAPPRALPSPYPGSAIPPLKPPDGGHSSGGGVVGNHTGNGSNGTGWQLEYGSDGHHWRGLMEAHGKSASPCEHRYIYTVGLILQGVVSIYQPMRTTPARWYHSTAACETRLATGCGC
jgi:hypothetical protein